MLVTVWKYQLRSIYVSKYLSTNIFLWTNICKLHFTLIWLHLSSSLISDNFAISRFFESLCLLVETTLYNTQPTAVYITRIGGESSSQQQIHRGTRICPWTLLYLFFFWGKDWRSEVNYQSAMQQKLLKQREEGLKCVETAVQSAVQNELKNEDCSNCCQNGNEKLFFRFDRLFYNPNFGEENHFGRSNQPLKKKMEKETLLSSTVSRSQTPRFCQNGSQISFWKSGKISCEKRLLG